MEDDPNTRIQNICAELLATLDNMIAENKASIERSTQVLANIQPETTEVQSGTETSAFD